MFWYFLPFLRQKNHRQKQLLHIIVYLLKYIHARNELKVLLLVHKLPLQLYLTGLFLLCILPLYFLSQKLLLVPNSRWWGMWWKCYVTLLSYWQKAFSALTKGTLSNSSCWYKSYIACIAASAIASCPALTCSHLRLAEHISLLRALLFPLLSDTILTPFGRSSGFLFSGINQFAMNASSLLSITLSDACMFLMQSFLKKFANDFWMSNEHELNDLKTSTLGQLSASCPDGPQSPFDFIATFIANAFFYIIINDAVDWIL